MITSRSPLGLASTYAEIGRQLARPGSRHDAMGAVGLIALARVPGVEWASITEGRRGRFATVTATDTNARSVDDIQYALHSGPCLDVLVHDSTFRTGHLDTEDRWPEFSWRASDAYGVHSMLSLRLYVENDPKIASLNLYSTKTDAFDDEAVTIATLVATHGALAIAAATARDEAAHLRVALVTNREIGVAMGVLIATQEITRDQAFGILRVASQNTNRKIADIATDVIDAGALALPGAGH
jgi:hypothetical protein